MSTEEKTTNPKSLQELETLMEKALKKIGGDKENDICRYLPVKTGGYMHHFTMRKMKTQTPDELTDLIKEYILNPASPKAVPHKPRAARGSRKRKNQIALNKEDWERILSFARAEGDKELVAKLTPRRSLPQLKKDLTASIKQGKVEEELWHSYVEMTRAMQNEENQNSSNSSNQIFALAETK